jgi:hypothetical protein
MKTTVALFLATILMSCAPGVFTVQRVPPVLGIVTVQGADFNENNSDIARTLKHLNRGDTIVVIGYKNTWWYAGIGSDTGFIYSGEMRMISKEEIYKSTPRIDKKTDEFTGEVTYYTPILEPVSITKFIKGKDTNYYLSLRTHGSTVVVDGKGAIVLFTDGSKLSFEKEDIDVKADGGSFQYSAFCTLSTSELSMFQVKKVKGFKLYIYDEFLESGTSELLKSNVDLITVAR